MHGNCGAAIPAAPWTWSPTVIAIMIAIVPIVLGSPLVLVLVPPAVPVIPAMLSRFVQLMTRPVRLPALRSVMFNGLMQTMVGPCNAALAVIIVGSQTRHYAEGEQARNYASDCRFRQHPTKETIS